jgi:hypothetical protein
MGVLRAMRSLNLCISVLDSANSIWRRVISDMMDYQCVLYFYKNYQLVSVTLPVLYNQYSKFPRKTFLSADTGNWFIMSEPRAAYQGSVRSIVV